MIYLITYDISARKPRSRMAMYLESIGRRLQKSVFLCDLTVKQMETARKKIKAYAEVNDDDVLIIPLCNGCQGKIRKLGQPVERFRIC
jgi:CRISPR-associated protein Cas2